MSAVRYTTTGVGEVEIVVSDSAPDDLFTRMAAGELPKNLYGVMDREAVLAHWTYNALRNGVYDASQLDGWADMSRGVVTFDVTSIDDVEVMDSEATS